ncbi:MAG: tetratricopeptide repeat protein [Planctomycetota bacterium]
MAQRKRIFVSAVSSELRHVRVELEAYLRALSYDSVHQEIFTQTHLGIVSMLREQISTCDAMICLIGHHYGYEPDTPPPGYPRRSYTQLEFFLAREMDLPVYLMLTDPEHPLPAPPGNPRTPGNPANPASLQTDEARLLQENYRQEVIRDRDWRAFHSTDHLLKQVSLLRFPWPLATADPEPAADAADDSPRDPEHAQVLAEVFGLASDTLPSGLPDYAAAYLEGDLLHAEQLALQAAHHAPEPGPDAARAYWIAGRAAAGHDRPDEALEHLRAADEQPDPDAALRIEIAQAIGSTQLAAGHRVAAIETLTAILPVAEQTRGPEHPTTMLTKGALAVALNLHGRFDDAESLAQGVLQFRRRALGPEHPRTLAARNTLAVACAGRGRLADAEDQYLELRRLCAKTLGPDHPRTLKQHFNVANCLCEQELYDEAREEYEELLALTEDTYPPDDPEVASVLNDLAWVHFKLEDFDPAQTYAQRAVRILTKLGRRRADTLQARHTQALILAAQGQTAKAVRTLKQVAQYQAQAFGQTHPETVTTRCDLAELLAQNPAADRDLGQLTTDLLAAAQSLPPQDGLAQRCQSLLDTLPQAPSPTT